MSGVAQFDMSPFSPPASPTTTGAVVERHRNRRVMLRRILLVRGGKVIPRGHFDLRQDLAD